MKALIDGDVVAYETAYSMEGCSWAEVVGDLEERIYSIMEGAECNLASVYLTGRNNYRKDVAVTKPYKGNRKSEKPFWLPQIREHLYKDGAKCEIDMEADDLLGIDCIKTGGVICTIDKDLDMIPGMHYNWLKHEQGVYEVDAEQGVSLFLKQLVTGDSVDNIPGIPRKGEKAFEKLSDENLGDIWGLWLSVLEMYRTHAPNNWMDYLEEQAKLLWICHFKKNEWEFDWFERYLSGLSQ